MRKTILHYMLSALFVAGTALSVASCTDDDLVNNQLDGDGDIAVSFCVNDVQSENISHGAPATRGTIATDVFDANFAGRKLEAQSNQDLDVCLIETTVEGVNPIIADVRTRANIKTTIDDDFSTTGIRGVTANNILTNPEWFHAEKTKKNGELYTPIKWAWAQPHARFFGVYPSKEKYSKMTIGNTSATTGSPDVEFEIDTDVKKQVDFMTACTGYVHYTTKGVAPDAKLEFRHALTAIRFAVGQNLSWNKTIDRVELRNVMLKSKYVLSKELTGTGAAWNHTGYSTRGTATLSGISVSTNKNPNVTIMGNAGDNYTFYMIPQVLTGNNVRAYIHFTDNTVIDVELKGEWKAGTTRTYKISQKNSDWNYTLTSTNPSRPATYLETESQPYGITSYREDGGTTQAVPWKVIGYDANNDGNFTMEEKPDWLTGLSKTAGDGGTIAEMGTATLTKDLTDLLEKRNKALREATPLGTVGKYYDLSTKGGSAQRNTANCYVISAPGHYRIPLVYGNAITGDNTNESSYKTSKTGDYILRNFKDHYGKDISNPWIEKTNNGANAGINGAKVVWADGTNLVHLASAPIIHDGDNAYLQFEVKAADIKSGNAVVAVTKNGTVVWSWHLWFAPQSVLDKVEVTNHQQIKYNFTTETIGWNPTIWSGSTYNKPRTVKVRVEQTITNKGTKQFTDITITQNPGNERKGIATLYQFGRKDAFPGTDDIKEGSFNKNAGDNMSITNGIQNPDKFYNHGSTWFNDPPAGYIYFNLWSAGNTTQGGNDDAVIKTIYDPSPAGFKMPASNAFTGFNITGEAAGGPANANSTAGSETNYKTNFGHNFWTNNSKTATIFFPASGYRDKSTGVLYYVGEHGFYWLAIPNFKRFGGGMFFIWNNVIPRFNYTPSVGFPVRPVSE
ncbi:MAG: hypothetical protein ACTTJN_01220 [Prevotella intermedia]